MNMFHSTPLKLRHSCIPDHPTKGGLSSPDEVAISRDDHFSFFLVVLWNISGLPVDKATERITDQRMNISLV